MRTRLSALAALAILFGACVDTPSEVAVSGVELSDNQIELVAGQTHTLTATVLPEDATNKAVQWESRVPNVASVDDNGLVIAKEMGATTIEVTTADGGFKASCHITVEPKIINAESVTVEPATLELTEGETKQLKATVLPEDTTDKTIEWRSADSKVATISEEGLVTAVGAGKATITAYCGAKTGTCEVTVKKVEVTGVTVTPPSITIMEGETHQLTATVSPAEADQTVQWASNDPKVATVDASGLVTAVKAGSTMVYARSKAFIDQQDVCEVTVTQDVTLKGISLSSAIMTLMVGESRTLTVTFTPSYAANKNITWSSSNPGVASVSDGTVTAFAEGKATITATSEEGGHTATCEVTVSGSGGPLVYYWNNSNCWVNGAPDPRNGMFDTSSLKLNTSYGAKGADVVGKTLYTLEVYNLYGRDIYLCKDREPLRKMPDGDFTDGTREVLALCAQEGYYAILQQVSRGSKYSVWRGSYDGDPVEIPITGSFKSTKGIDFLKMRALPDGRIIVAALITDAYNEIHIATYTILPGSESSDETIVCSASYSSEPAIAVDEDGNVYLFFMDYPGMARDHFVGCLYKNGVFVSNVEEIQYCSTPAVACSGGHVYIAVYDQNGGNEIRIRKDGELLHTIPVTDATTGGMHYKWNRPLLVTPSGDVYIPSTFEGKSSSGLYKNGELLYSASYWAFYHYCVIE